MDTTGRITSLDGLEAQALLTATHVYYRKSDTETRVFDLSRVRDFTITPTKARRWLTLLATWLLPIISPFIFGGLFAFRLLQVLVFGLVGLLVARMVKAPLDFPALMRLTTVALTPALVLEPLLELVRWTPPVFELIWCVLVLGYVVWAVLANRPAAEASEHTLTPPQTSSEPPPA